jgi:hypothetical protein
MVKRIARYGFKSGILPKPRQIVEPFKTPAEIEQAEKENIGFRDPELIPKGVAAKVPLKERVPASYKIEHSAKEAQGNKASADWKKLNADIRRKYLTQSLLTQEAEEKAIMERRQRQLEKDRQARIQRLERTKVSEATRLTLPTIQSFLTNQPLVTRRTPEEIALLKSKREANRKAVKLKHLTQKSNDVLELYQSSANFITTEAKLKSAIEACFNSSGSPYASGSQYISNEVQNVFSTGNAKGANASSLNELTAATLGLTKNFLPGLGEVQGAISGETKTFLDAHPPAANKSS